MSYPTHCPCARCGAKRQSFRKDVDQLEAEAASLETRLSAVRSKLSRARDRASYQRESDISFQSDADRGCDEYVRSLTGQLSPQ